MAALQGSYSRKSDADNTEDRLWKGISLKMLDTDHTKQICDSTKIQKHVKLVPKSLRAGQEVI